MEANKIDTFTTILPDFQRMNNIIYIFLFSSPPPQNKWFVLRNSFSTESFSTTLHSAPYLSRRGAKNNLLFSNTLCHFKCSHSIPWDVTSILTTLFPIQYFALSFSLLFFFSLLIPILPRTSWSPFPAHCPSLPIFPHGSKQSSPFPWLSAEEWDPSQLQIFTHLPKPAWMQPSGRRGKAGARQTDNRTI